MQLALRGQGLDRGVGQALDVAVVLFQATFAEYSEFVIRQVHFFTFALVRRQDKLFVPLHGSQEARIARLLFYGDWQRHFSMTTMTELYTSPQIT